MIAGAASAGLGAALVPRFLVEDELATGRLVVLFDRPLRSGTAYWYVFPEEKSDRRWCAASANGCVS